MRSVEVNVNSDIGLTNAEGSESFKFDTNNAYFFRTMIDSLYSDKVSSVIREIVANAIDAHAMAKVKPTRPVEVSLPTMFSPKFEVRDFGDGMSHEFVMGPYSTLGRSTKTQTNVATGMFGLGAKTPFSIADNFEVRVYQDGAERQYRCFYNEHNYPAIVLANTIATTEPNGVRIVVPIADRDTHNKFEKAVDAAALCYFDQAVSFNRATSSGINTSLKNGSGITRYCGDFYLRTGSASSSRLSNGMILVRQGFAVYPLDLGKLPSFKRHTFMGSDDILSSIANQYSDEIMIDCPIGTFEVTPSREAVQYTTRSVDNLDARVFKILDQVRDELSKLIGDAKTYPEAMLKLLDAKADRTVQSTIRSTNERVRYYHKAICKNFTADYEKMNGINVTWLDNSFNYEAVLNVNGDIRPGPHKNVSLNRTVLTRLGVINGTCYSAKTGSTDLDCGVSKVAELTIVPFTPVLYVPSDLRNWEDRCHHFMRLHGPFDVNKANTAYAIVRAARVELPKIKEYVDAHNVVTFDLIDDTRLIEPPKVIAARANRVVKPRPAPNDAFVLDSIGQWTEKKNVDFSEPCYLVVRDKRHGVIGVADDAAQAAFASLKCGADGDFAGLTLRATMNESGFARVVKAARNLSILDPTLPIYSLNRSQYERIQKQGVSPDMLMDTLLDALPAIVTRFQNDMAVSMAVRQTFGAVTTRTLRLVASLTEATSEKRLKLAQALFTDRLFLAQHALSMLSAVSTSGKAYLPPEAFEMMVTARSVTGRYDDLISSLTNEYTGLYGRLNRVTKIANVHRELFVLVPEEYSLAASVDVEDDVYEYVLAKINSSGGTHDAMATALLNDLPMSVRKVVIASMKATQAHVASLLTVLRNKPTLKQTKAVA